MKKSAGLLLFRWKDSALQVFLVHMGGPFWQHKESRAWTIPKGEFEEEESPLDAAVRECQEETGLRPTGSFIELTPAKQSGGKLVLAWALEWDCDPTIIQSNTFSTEWPKGSGMMSEFPEIDRAAWFSLSDARTKIVRGQIPLLEELAKILGAEN